MIIGLDFDNTIVSYDQLFHRVSCEQGLIKNDFPINKIKIRDYLRSIDKEHKWTEMQGYVYGNRMNEAKSFNNVKDFIKNLNKGENKLIIISHKTQFPFAGEKYDLHKAAKEWISNNLVSPEFSLNDCFFEETKEKKISRISEQGCDFYIDDLPEILQNHLFPQNCNKILFDPENNYFKLKLKNITVKNSWEKISSHFSASDA